MSDHIPLTEQQLDDIEARATAATPGPWEPYPDYGPTFYANTTGAYLRGVGDFNFGVGEQAEADEAFVRHAQQDVTVLDAEVRRRRRQVRFLLGQLAKRDAASGEADRKVREFLGAAGPDPICGDENDGDWCELEPGHDGHHRADTAEWAAAPASAVAVSGGEQ